MPSLGGILGSMGISLCALFIPIRPLMFTSLVLTAVGVALFPHFTDSMVNMKMMGFLCRDFCYGIYIRFFRTFLEQFSFFNFRLRFGYGAWYWTWRRRYWPNGPWVFYSPLALAFQNVALIMGVRVFFGGYGRVSSYIKKREPGLKRAIMRLNGADLTKH